MPPPSHPTPPPPPPFPPKEREGLAPPPLGGVGWVGGGVCLYVCVIFRKTTNCYLSQFDLARHMFVHIFRCCWMDLAEPGHGFVGHSAPSKSPPGAC